MSIVTTLLSNPDNALAFLQLHGYWIMLLLMFIEGPIITYIAAFAASSGIFNIYIVFILAVIGDVAPDMLFFLIGRLGKHEKAKRYVGRFLDEERIKRLREQLKNNPWKTITLIKITPVLPVPGFILTGTTDMKISRFLFCSVVISAAYSLFFSVLGFYSGLAFYSIARYIRYGGFFVISAIVLTVVVWFLQRYFSRRYSDKWNEKRKK